MTIREIIGQGFHYARTCRSLWIFGFVVGLASGGSSGGGTSGGGGAAAGGEGAFDLANPIVAAIAIAAIVLAIVAFIVRFVSEGALIEGVARARQGGPMTVREAFEAGWAHWGVLLRIALIYVAATVGSLVVLVAPCILAWRAFGPIAGVTTGLPAMLVAVPWLVTLYLVQAFATRIAVLENRHALDAIGKARLFLHGRLMHGLRLIVASLVGSVVIATAAVLLVLPIVLSMVALIRITDMLSVILLLGLVLVPVGFIVTAFLGTFRSSIWTVGYMTEVQP